MIGVFKLRHPEVYGIDDVGLYCSRWISGKSNSILEGTYYHLICTGTPTAIPIPVIKILWGRNFYFWNCTSAHVIAG
ncbi:hypothetical protein AARAC_000528 [Aspergillus arachidicola]|uniref:Uncharacterized protein n=1 Tax=Aspergillus arachidicola TaxID=656916 RepID=A0A2G7G7B0_9EURO|nr:hypothetical protein AARAC_000528 [Aspergillus arachidicola]